MFLVVSCFCFLADAADAACVCRKHELTGFELTVYIQPPLTDSRKMQESMKLANVQDAESSCVEKVRSAVGLLA